MHGEGGVCGKGGGHACVGEESKRAVRILLEYVLLVPVMMEQTPVPGITSCTQGVTLV